MSNAGILSEKGDVQATGTMTDNRVIRGDGTTKIQDSGVTLDDLDNISGVNTLAVSDAPTTRSNLGLGSISTQDSNNISVTGGTMDGVTITGGSVTGITDLAIADGGTGASTAADARTNLGLGTMATQEANNVTITGGSITGITDLVVADGGTGVSSNTAYAVLCGGTTTTGAIQSVASLGTSGQVLTSNGMGALPTFQDASGEVPGPGSTFLCTTANTWTSISPVIESGSTTTTDVLHLIPFVLNKSITLTKVGVFPTSSVAGSFARMGIYEQSTSTGNFTLVTDYGTVSVATGNAMASIAATDVLDANKLYWFALVIDENGGAVSISGRSSSSPAFIFSDTINDVVQDISKNAVGTGALAATYNYSDFTENTGTAYNAFYQGTYT